MSSPEKPCRVLVVDDDSPLREVMGRSMRRLGHHVIMVPSAEAALASTELWHLTYDVVITDVHLPNMNGVELADILLERRYTRRIVIVTGDHDENLARQVRARLGVSYLPKPFDLDDLEALVNEKVAE